VRCEGVDQRPQGEDSRSQGVDSRFEGVDLRSEGVDLWSQRVDLRSQGMNFRIYILIDFHNPDHDKRNLTSYLLRKATRKRITEKSIVWLGGWFVLGVRFSFHES
jgi:hypothetical protein